MSFEFQGFSEPNLAARALVDAIVGDLKEALKMRERAVLLLSGGTSPIPVFHELAKQALPWERIDVSLVDERSVPSDSEDSNAGLLQHHFFKGAASAARWIPLLPAALLTITGDPWRAAQLAATQANAQADLQRADVILLGLGEDGHTASLFPDAPQWPEARTTTARYIAIEPQHAPHPRVSLSLHALRCLPKCYLWAPGAAKLATLAHLRSVCELAERDVTGNDAIAQAGPIACLMADATVLLNVYCDGPR